MSSKIRRVAYQEQITCTTAKEGQFQKEKENRFLE
jgi:hypothetical protein